ncbi:MAG: hypothetical protein KKF62_06020 [Bacteroidetes bacterium]|nr:hypothetical protein [Bacteroidota bacterium]MBU1114539.1 hypothetical protein [Bacteroidota bacterium]MBU1798718.1 hypothetical protein [Bacteroidota bacterium]
MKSTIVFQMILLTMFGFVGSVLVGFIFYNSLVFAPNLITFQFVTVGISGALFFSLLKYKSTKEQLIGITIIFLLDFVLIIGKPFSISLIIRDILYLSSMFLAIKLYYKFIQRNSTIKYYLRTFALVFIYCLLTVVFGTVVYLINAKFEFPLIDFLLAITKISILVGFGIGIGIDFYLQNENYIMKYLKLITA